MSWRRETCWTLTCDSCGEGWAGEHDAVPHFAVQDDARRYAVLAGWLITDGRASCRDCVRRARCGQEGHEWSAWEAFDCGQVQVGRTRQEVRECLACSELGWRPAADAGRTSRHSDPN